MSSVYQVYCCLVQPELSLAYNPDQPRDEDGKFGEGSGSGGKKQKQGKVRKNDSISQKTKVTIPAKAFDTDDAYVYHTAPKGPLNAYAKGLLPSDDGEAGPGVYMGNTIDNTLGYHVSADKARHFRIDKVKLIEKFGTYPEKEDGLQYDPSTGEILLPGSSKISADLLEVKVNGSWKPLLSVRGLKLSFDQSLALALESPVVADAEKRAKKKKK